MSPDEILRIQKETAESINNADYATRKKALGSEVARKELDDLERRVESCRASSEGPSERQVDRFKSIGTYDGIT